MSNSLRPHGRQYARLRCPSLSQFTLPSKGFPGGSTGKESSCKVGDLGSIPGLGRSPGDGSSYPLQYSGLEKTISSSVVPFSSCPQSLPASVPFRWVSTSYQVAKVLVVLGKWGQRRGIRECIFTRPGEVSKAKQNKCMKSRKADYRRNIFFLEVSLDHYSSFFSPISLLSPPPFFYTVSPSPSSASSSSSHPPLYLAFTPSSLFLDFVLWVYTAVKCYWS